MRILVHDYVGHPFQVQLSRALADRGHHLLHLYNASFETPRGELTPRDTDATTFDVRGVALPEVIPKTDFYRRFRLETDYSRRLINACEPFRPDVVLSANTPSIAQHRLAKWCQRHGVRLVSWVQDIYGLATYRLLGKKLPGLGHAVGHYFIALDRGAAKRSDAIVVISEDFTDVIAGWGVDTAKIHTVHNWAPLEDLPVRPRDNAWSAEQGLGDGLRIVYSGTLAMKHNPALLFELAKMLDERRLGEVIVVSEGAGVQWLDEQAKKYGVRSLRLLGFQPFDALPDVLGSADLLVAVLEEDAGVFSVPSKVLSYLCASRPLLLAVPSENLAAKIVRAGSAGCVVEPSDLAGFCEAGMKLLEDAQLRESCGRAARRFAEEHFDIGRICDRFEAILGG